MAVIRAGSSQFPFHITDIASLLRLNIRRRGPDFLYVDCPLCGDHRGKLYLKTSRDVWHCNYCQESGGMLALYANDNECILKRLTLLSYNDSKELKSTDTLKEHNGEAQ